MKIRRINAVPRPFLLLALLVVFSGTPMRLAEAADDLARCLAGPEVGGEFEVVDGGVGDDPVETIRADPAHDPLVDATVRSFAAILPPAWPIILGRFRPRDLTRSPIPSSPTSRHILLGRLLC
jgi:hypothetical protein